MAHFGGLLLYGIQVRDGWDLHPSCFVRPAARCSEARSTTIIWPDYYAVGHLPITRRFPYASATQMEFRMAAI